MKRPVEQVRVFRQPLVGLIARCRAAQDDREIVTGNSRHDIAVINAAQADGYFDEQLVTDEMPGRFIDRPEIVEIEERNGKGRLVADVAAQDRPKRRAIFESGQRIVLDLKLDAFALRTFGELVSDKSGENVDESEIVLGERGRMHRFGTAQDEDVRFAPDL
jgi:hypothetical protein